MQKGTVRIKLTQGFFALIDSKDSARVSKFKWFAERHKNGRVYASTNVPTDKGKRLLRMHRFILKPPLTMDTDHRNHNCLDNRNQNLRICTRSQNLMNRARKCVVLKKESWRKKKWASMLQVRGQVTFIGHFLTRKEAIAAYKTKAKELHGEFAFNYER